MMSALKLNRFLKIALGYHIFINLCKGFSAKNYLFSSLEKGAGRIWSVRVFGPLQGQCFKESVPANWRSCLVWRRWNLKFTTNLSDKEDVDFGMSRNGFCVSCLGILPDGVWTVIPVQEAPI